MKRISVALLALSLTTAAFAQSSQTSVKATTPTINVPAPPKVKKAEDVVKFTLQSEQSNIESSVLETNPINQVGDRILISDCKAGSIVRISDINGRLFFLESVDSSGSMEISLAEYAQGIYLISVNTFTYKIIKK